MAERMVPLRKVGGLWQEFKAFLTREKSEFEAKDFERDQASIRRALDEKMVAAVFGLDGPHHEPDDVGAGADRQRLPCPLVVAHAQVVGDRGDEAVLAGGRPERRARLPVALVDRAQIHRSHHRLAL